VGVAVVLETGMTGNSMEYSVLLPLVGNLA